MKKVIIAGSSRNNGDTKKLTNAMVEKSGWDLIELADYEIGYFDYEHRNRDDDYLPLIREIITDYETLIFATPVYWYSMSGIMKVFFDRFTDLLTIEKDLGRKLRGKSMAAISCSGGGNLGESFWLPFRETANYLGMKYLGHLHTTIGEDNDMALTEFISSIEDSEKPEK